MLSPDRGRSARSRRCAAGVPARRSRCAAIQAIASRQSRTRLRASIASNGCPNASPLRVLTSTTTTAARSATTRSSSPSRHRQLRSRTVNPCCSKYRAARSSPARPSTSLSAIPASSRARIRARTRGCGIRSELGTGPANRDGGEEPAAQVSSDSSSGRWKSRRDSSSTLTSLNVSTRTAFTKRSAR